MNIPSELIEWILSLCSFEDILRCQSVCRLFHTIITNSLRLTYIIDLALSGYTDAHVSPRCDLDTRRRMLAQAQRVDVWKRAASFELVEMLSFNSLSYWPVRDGVLLRIANPDAADNLFDVSVVSHAPGPPTRSWRVTLPVSESGILCIDPGQDLIIVRVSQSSIKEDLLYFSCSPLSLRSGLPHPRAKQRVIRLRVSERVQTKPHYTRLQVHGQTLAISMASGFQFFTEIAVFDWTSGEQIASFCSSSSEPRAWGDPAVLISPTCFLLASYSRTDQTPIIEVHAIDDSQPPRNLDGNMTRPAAHIASFCLPRTRLGEVRMLLTPSSAHQTWGADEDAGYLMTRPEALMLRVYICSTQFQLRDAGFFMPLRPFVRELASYFALSPEERRTHVSRVLGSEEWMRHTRWLNPEPVTWMSEVRRNQKGAGPRYVFPRCIVDFSPLELAKEVNARKRSDPELISFESDLDGYSTFCGTSELTETGGANLFVSTFSFSLPYREKILPELPGYSPDSDLHLIGDKLVSVEGGVQDEVKIYQLVPEKWSGKEE